MHAIHIITLLICITLAHASPLGAAGSTTISLGRTSMKFLLPISLLDSQPLSPIFDTGSGQMVIFDQTYCDSLSSSTVDHDIAGCLNVTDRAVSSAFHVHATPTDTTPVPSTLLKYSLNIDGQEVSAAVRKIVPIHAAMGSNPPLFPPKLLSNRGYIAYSEVSPYQDYWNATSGTIGTGPVILASAEGVVATSSIFWELMGHLNATGFGLDLTDIDSASITAMTSPNPNSGATWSDSLYLFANNYYYFSGFHLSLCGVDLMANHSSNMPFLPDTGVECISLPAELFNYVVAWIPGNCTYTVGTHLECLVTTDTLSKLPMFSFKLSESGPEFHVPLSYFIEDQFTSIVSADIRKIRLCLIKNMEIWRTRFPHIGLGTRFLRAFKSLFDVPNGRVGLIQADSIANVNVSDVVCPSHVTCGPGFTYNPTTNSCLVRFRAHFTSLS